MDISIYEIPDMAASVGASDDDRTLMWRSTEPRSALAHAVIEAAQSVLRRLARGLPSAVATASLSRRYVARPSTTAHARRQVLAPAPPLVSVGLPWTNIAAAADHYRSHPDHAIALA